MNTAAWLRAKEIVADLAAVAAHERSARMAILCGDDAALRAEVERLLALDPDADRYFDELQGILGQDSDPTQVGPYRIVRQIGHGGMGAVYLGERSDGQFEQRVAIKVVRDGIAGRLLERFHEERRILAQLEHPGIAYLLDGGSLADGRPYFVMEHVEGESITDYANRRRLPVAARLELFRRVCEAVAYAHRNLVVHRDLKPGNIMVEEDDQGQPSIKLLDFGIARILEQELAEAAAVKAIVTASGTPRATSADPALTEIGDRLLTPSYSAPEQLRGEPATTAVDVHALGILLHELLTGLRPFGGAAASRADMERAILEDAPSLPSDAARNADADTAALRATAPATLARRLRGDLDCIVLKALHKQPEGRYASVWQLSDDIGRHLRGMPVSTRRGEWAYRAGIFLRRHRWGVAATTLAVVATLAAGTLHVERITQERDYARAQTAKAEEVTQLLVGMFDSADPGNARGQDVTVREVLDKASASIGDELVGQPELRAKMLDIMGSIHARLGNFETAERMLKDGLALRRQLHGPRHLDVADSLQNLAVLAWMRGNDDKAEGLLREVLEQRIALLGPGHLKVASARNDLAAVLRRQGRLDDAGRLYRQAIQVRRAQLGDQHPDVISSRNNLAILLENQGRLEDAEALYREVLAARRAKLGPIHPRIANTLGNLSVLLRNQQRYEEAEVLVREGLKMRLQVFDATHPLVAHTMNTLAGVLRGQGKYDEAESLYRKALGIRRDSLGPRHRVVASSLNNLANLYRDQGKSAKAEPLYREAISIYRETVGDEHAWTATSIKNLGELYLKMDDAEAAEARFREALRIREKTNVHQPWLVAETRSLLGESLARQGRQEPAMALLERSHAELLESLGAQDELTLDAWERLLALRAPSTR